MILVAAAGGGARAAYWSAKVLGALADRGPDFARKVFAISAVSGGALGSAAFVALDPADPHCNVHDQPKNSFQDCLRVSRARFHEPDHRLVSDWRPGAARVLPFTSLVDRADALERAWEDA